MKGEVSKSECKQTEVHVCWNHFTIWKQISLARRTKRRQMHVSRVLRTIYFSDLRSDKRLECGKICNFQENALINNLFAAFDS